MEEENEIKKDYRKNQRVLAKIVLKDEGQDFTELDILENGVLLGNSPMFKNGRLSLLGVGTKDGKKYFSFNEMRKAGIKQSFKGLFIYIKDTGEKDPLPWETGTLIYPIIGMKKAIKPNRFIV
jgi:hypothetical protein